MHRPVIYTPVFVTAVILSIQVDDYLANRMDQLKMALPVPLQKPVSVMEAGEGSEIIVYFSVCQCVVRSFLYSVKDVGLAMTGVHVFQI